MSRAKSLVLGALVADAAAMGLHWIYDQDHILRIAPDRPEFQPPDPANYADVPAFFAHPTRQAGDPSQYGVQTLVMMRSLLASEGRYDAAHYAQSFRDHFGYGGAYVGYIDHATRDTLDNARRAQDAALAAAMALPYDGPEGVTRALVTKALALRAQHSGPALAEAFEQAVLLTHDDDAVVAHGQAVLAALDDVPAPTGARDVQLPAIAKLPPLVAVLEGAEADDAAFEDAVTSAVRTTNDHPTAVDFGLLCARMMQAALRHGDLEAVQKAAQTHGSAQTQPLIAEALARLPEDPLSTTRHFGMACDLAYGVPSALHNMLSAPSFCTAVRHNIHAGGDSCGRAILLGAVLGAVHGIGGTKGIPTPWIDQLSDRETLFQVLDALL